MDKSKLYVYGGGGHSLVVCEIAELMGFDIAGVYDKKPASDPILGKYLIRESASAYDLKQDCVFVLAIGNNDVRKGLVESIFKSRSFATLIHPSSNLSTYVKIGNGTVVMSGVSVNPNVRIGMHCILNTNSSVDHECLIGDFVHISPNASIAGNVSIGERTHIGIGATIIQGISIGKCCIIGAGAVIINDVPDGSTVVGNPGKIIKVKEVS